MEKLLDCVFEFLWEPCIRINPGSAAQGFDLGN